MVRGLSGHQFLRKGRRATAVALSTAVGLTMSGTALAAPAGADGPEGNCSFSAIWYLYAGDPTNYSATGSVYDNGEIDQSPTWSCEQNSGTVFAQTKVCGFFGCNYETKASYNSDAKVLRWAHVAYQDCRADTNRYRTITRFDYLIWDSSSFGYVDESTSATSAALEFTCK